MDPDPAQHITQLLYLTITSVAPVTNSKTPARPNIASPDARSTSILMTQCPYICGDCRQLIGSEFRSTHGRHRAAIFLRVGHSFSDRFQNSGIAAIAPEPLFRSKTWTQRGA